MLHAQLDDVAGRQEGWRLHRHADARWCAGRDQVAGLQRHELRQVVHDEMRTEDHRRGAAGLPTDAVDVEFETQIAQVAHVVRRGEPGARGREGVARLALGPLSAAFDLELALRDVVHDAVTGDVGGGRVHRIEVARIAADDDAKLHLPVRFLRATRDQHVVVRTDHGVAALQEDDRLARDLCADLCRVIAVVETNAHELSGPRDARCPPGVGRDRAQRCTGGEQRIQSGQAARAEELRRPVDEVLAAVEATAVAHDAWPFSARDAPSDQLHDRMLTSGAPPWPERPAGSPASPRSRHRWRPAADPRGA